MSREVFLVTPTIALDDPMYEYYRINGRLSLPFCKEIGMKVGDMVRLVNLDGLGYSSLIVSAKAISIAELTDADFLPFDGLRTKREILKSMRESDDTVTPATVIYFLGFRKVDYTLRGSHGRTYSGTKQRSKTDQSKH